MEKGIIMTLPLIPYLSPLRPERYFQVDLFIGKNNFQFYFKAKRRKMNIDANEAKKYIENEGTEGSAQNETQESEGKHSSETSISDSVLKEAETSNSLSSRSVTKEGRDGMEKDDTLPLNVGEYEVKLSHGKSKQLLHLKMGMPRLEVEYFTADLL